MRAARLQPFPIGLAPFGARTRGAHIGHLGAGLDQQPGHQQFRALVARHGHARVDPVGFHRRLDRRQGLRLGGIDFRRRDIGRLADRLQPGRRAVKTHRRRAHHRPAGGMEFAHRRDVERMHRRHGHAIERGIQVAPLARRDCGATVSPIGASMAPTPTGSDGNNSPIRVTIGSSIARLRGRATGPCSASSRA